MKTSLRSTNKIFRKCNTTLQSLYNLGFDLILDGKKTIESRFTKIRCAPYGKIDTGDVVYLKESGGPVKGQFTVCKVETYTDLTSEMRHEINRRYHRHIFVDPQFQGFWEKWSASKYATLIHVDNVSAYKKPIPFPKKDGRAWVLLDKPLSFPEH